MAEEACIDREQKMSRVFPGKGVLGYSPDAAVGGSSKTSVALGGGLGGLADGSRGPRCEGGHRRREAQVPRRGGVRRAERDAHRCSVLSAVRRRME